VTGGEGYNGLLDYGITLDTGKLDWWSGGLLAFNAQSSFGKPLKTEAGNVSPVNYTALFPKFFEDSTVLMEYYWIQALPKKMVLTFGRLDAVNFLDRNRFANDPRNQFLNVSLGNDLLWGYFLSFSTYGVLLDAPVTKNVSVGGAYWTPNTQPGDYGGDFSDVGLAAFVDGKWEFGKGLGGEANLVLAYSSADTGEIDNPRFTPGLITGNVPTESDNWLVAFDLEQYLWKPGKSAGATRPARTRSFDFQEPGLGLFFRFGYTPADRNPWNISISGGVSGRGLIPGRPYDRAGIGAYTLLESGDLRDKVILGDLTDSEVGLEGFYNFAITPWIQISADVQWISSGIQSNDNAWVVGSRLYTQF
jgi:porin